MIEGAEALIRGLWETTNFHSPMDFIPVAEGDRANHRHQPMGYQRCAQYLQDWQKICPPISVWRSIYRPSIFGGVSGRISERR